MIFFTELKILARWAPAVVNHLYWSICTCHGNGEELVERFMSLKHHIVNKHHFDSNVHYKECEHCELTTEEARTKDWMLMGSPAHEKLCKIISEKALMVDMKQMTEQINTTMLEVFHATKIGYLPKKTFFGIEKMIAGTQIAALEHNNNVNREQVSKSNLLV